MSWTVAFGPMAAKAVAEEAMVDARETSREGGMGTVLSSPSSEEPPPPPPPSPPPTWRRRDFLLEQR